MVKLTDVLNRKYDVRSYGAISDVVIKKAFEIIFDEKEFTQADLANVFNYPEKTVRGFSQLASFLQEWQEQNQKELKLSDKENDRLTQAIRMLRDVDKASENLEKNQMAAFLKQIKNNKPKKKGDYSYKALKLETMSKSSPGLKQEAKEKLTQAFDEISRFGYTVATAKKILEPKLRELALVSQMEQKQGIFNDQFSDTFLNANKLLQELHLLPVEINDVSRTKKLTGLKAAPTTKDVGIVNQFLTELKPRPEKQLVVQDIVKRFLKQFASYPATTNTIGTVNEILKELRISEVKLDDVNANSERQSSDTEKTSSPLDHRQETKDIPLSPPPAPLEHRQQTKGIPLSPPPAPLDQQETKNIHLPPPLPLDQQETKNIPLPPPLPLDQQETKNIHLPPPLILSKVPPNRVDTKEATLDIADIAKAAQTPSASVAPQTPTESVAPKEATSLNTDIAKAQQTPIEKLLSAIAASANEHPEFMQDENGNENKVTKVATKEALAFLSAAIMPHDQGIKSEDQAVVLARRGAIAGGKPDVQVRVEKELSKLVTEARLSEQLLTEITPQLWIFKGGKFEKGLVKQALYEENEKAKSATITPEFSSQSSVGSSSIPPPPPQPSAPPPLTTNNLFTALREKVEKKIEGKTIAQRIAEAEETEKKFAEAKKKATEARPTLFGSNSKMLERAQSKEDKKEQKDNDDDDHDLSWRD